MKPRPVPATGHGKSVCVPKAMEDEEEKAEEIKEAGADKERRGCMKPHGGRVDDERHASIHSEQLPVNRKETNEPQRHTHSHR